MFLQRSNRTLAFAALFATACIFSSTKADDVQCDSDAYQFPAYSPQALQSRYDKSIVLISCEVRLPDHRSLGTGFLIDSKSGLFLTALHVVQDDEKHDYNCTTSGKPIFAYVMGDMCERTELEYVTGSTALDIALLRVKQVSTASTSKTDNPFFGRPHFEMLARGMNVNEAGIHIIGFSQFAALLVNSDAGSADRKSLPGEAGGHTCSDQPQRFKSNPLVIPNQKVFATTSYLRENGIREGDSGAPAFIADGRVAGIVTQIGIGGDSPGTKVISANDITKWVVSILASNKGLNDSIYSLELWSDNSKLADALSPSICNPSISCLPNIRIAAQLQRIRAKAVNISVFSGRQKEKLRCPLYAATKARDIVPESDYLKTALEQNGMEVAELPAYQLSDKAIERLTNPNLTAYSKQVALEHAEARAANTIDDVRRMQPTVVTAALCNAGVTIDQAKLVEGQLDDYLENFRPADASSPAPEVNACPKENVAQVDVIRNLVTMIADLKIAQAKLTDAKPGTNEYAAMTSSVIALSALVNSGEKNQARALIDFGDAYVLHKPDVAASAYAKAYKIEPSKRALSSFADAAQRSPELKQGTARQSNPKALIYSKDQLSVLPKIDQRFIAETIMKNPILPGRI